MIWESTADAIFLFGTNCLDLQPGEEHFEGAFGIRM
jgi:hypothetical protein